MEVVLGFVVTHLVEGVRSSWSYRSNGLCPHGEAGEIAQANRMYNIWIY